MKVILKVLFLLCVTLGYSQYFAGEITYRTTIIPNDGVELDPGIMETDGKINSYLITSGKYKNAYLDDEGNETYSYTYHNGSKRMYDRDATKGYITYRDSRKGNTSSASAKVIKDSIEFILGYPCYRVEREKAYGTAIVYYSDSIQVDFESFSEHAVGNWYEEIKQVNGSISIKTITKYATHISIMEAINIERKELDKEVFKLPEVPTVASFQSLDAGVELIPLDKAQFDCYNKYAKKAARIKGRTKDHTTYVRFVVTESGEIMFMDVYNPDEFGLDEMALEIMRGCDLMFIPGKIGGVTVASEAFFPIEFKLN